MVSCDAIMTVRAEAVGRVVGVFLDDQESELARAISDAFELSLL